MSAPYPLAKPARQHRITQPKRKRRRLRQHTNPLSARSLEPRNPVALPQNRIIEVALGCGDAQFLIERAEHHPELFFVGLDIRNAFLAFGKHIIADKKLNNIRLETCNLVIDTPHLFGPGSVKRFYINFPDPWFKARTTKRSWLTARTLADLVTALTPDGEIFYQSDVWDPTLTALALAEANEDLENIAGPWTFLKHNPFSARSAREVSCQDDGLPIWRLHFRRLPTKE